MLIKQDYKTAIDIQSACNMLAVVKEFAAVMGEIGNEACCSEDVTDHPIVVMYLNQLCHLAKVDGPSFDQFHKAHKTCQEREE